MTIRMEHEGVEDTFDAVTEEQAAFLETPAGGGWTRCAEQPSDVGDLVPRGAVLVERGPEGVDLLAAHKDTLLKMADDIGVAVPRSATKAEIVEALRAADAPEVPDSDVVAEAPEPSMGVQGVATQPGPDDLPDSDIAVDETLVDPVTIPPTAPASADKEG